MNGSGEVPVAKAFFLSAALVASFFAIVLAAFARDDQVIELRSGFTTLLRFDRTVTTVAIGNVDIADTVVQSDRAVLLTAKKVGETNLIVIDDQGRDFYRATLLVGGGETGRVVFHTRKVLHEYWTYHCTAYSCQRVDDKFEFRERPAPIVVAPAAPVATTE